MFEQNSSTHTLYNQAKTAFRTQKFQPALQAINHVLLAKDCTLEMKQKGRVIKAFSLLHLKKYNKALPAFDKVLEYNPDHVEALYYRAWLSSRLVPKNESEQDKVTRLKKACRYYKRAIEQRPQFRDALQNLAALRFKLKEYDKALEHYQTLIKLEPSKPNHHKNCALIYRAQNRHQQALVCLEQALKIDKNYKKALLLKSEVESQLSVWAFDGETQQRLNEQFAKNHTGTFAIANASDKESRRVMEWYCHDPIPGYDVVKIEVIDCVLQRKSFEAHVKKLQNRAKAKVFSPNFTQEKHVAWRNVLSSRLKTMCQPFQDPIATQVNFLPGFHGTREAILESLLRTGYANLATTDAGFFGKGIYNADSAEYAHRVYSKGCLLVNWIAFFSAYPVCKGDEKKLFAKGNYGNYDAHIVPVVPRSKSNLNEVNYDACKPFKFPTYYEYVTFESASCLPRYRLHVKQQQIDKTLTPNGFETLLRAFYKDKFALTLVLGSGGLNVAIRQSDEKLLALWLKSGANPLAADGCGFLPIMTGLFHPKRPIAEAVLEAAQKGLSHCTKSSKIAKDAVAVLRSVDLYIQHYSLMKKSYHFNSWINVVKAFRKKLKTTLQELKKEAGQNNAPKLTINNNQH